jgi:tetratricopeptide (TPR) repeat protein
MRVTLTNRLVDLDNGQVKGGQRLTQFECTVVRYLRQHRGQTVTRDQMMVAVWRYPKPVASRCVDTAIRRIRGKIEENRNAPKHLLTIQGEGYRWWEADEEPEAVVGSDRTCGRTQWAEQLTWAEATFGRILTPHSAEVGLSQTIRAAYLHETAALPDSERALLDLLCLAQAGWTPNELAHHAPPAALRGLLRGRWVVVVGDRVCLERLWWPVRTDGADARAVAAELWADRLKGGGDPDLLELGAVFLWPQVTPQRAADLLLLATERFLAAGLFHQLIGSCDAVLARSLSPTHRIRLRLMRGAALRRMGLLAPAQEDVEQAAEEARREAPQLLGDALAGLATIAHLVGDFERAQEHYPRAIRLAEPAATVTLTASYAGLLWAQGEAERALETCRAAVQIAVRHNLSAERTHAERGLARTLLSLGRPSEAVARLNAIQDTSNDALADAVAHSALLMYGHIELGQMDQAQRHLEQALAHDPDLLGVRAASGVQEAHGILLGVQGAWRAAREAQMRAIAIRDFAPVRTIVPRCWLAIGERELGDREGGVRMLELAGALCSDQTSTMERTVFALACQAMAVDGPPVPAAVDTFAFARIARRAWKMD